MGSIGRNKSFFKMQVDILRPAFAVDVTSIRDQILTDYVIINTDIKCFIEPVQSGLIADRQLGGIEVARSSGFFNKNENIKVNDILRENANAYNSNTIRYWKVTGRLDYSRYDWIVRVDLDDMNYNRQ